MERGEGPQLGGEGDPQESHRGAIRIRCPRSRGTVWRDGLDEGGKGGAVPWPAGKGRGREAQLTSTPTEGGERSAI
jgi:hypothetical protein